MSDDVNMQANADHEFRAHADQHASLRLWLRLLTCTQLIEKQVRHQLRTEFDTTLPRFDLMAQLERAPDGMKMNELSRRMMVTGGNVTGITDQLVAEGLVERLHAHVLAGLDGGIHLRHLVFPDQVSDGGSTTHNLMRCDPSTRRSLEQGLGYNGLK